MSAHSRFAALIAAALVLGAMSLAAVSEAGIGDSLKKKAKDTANKTADDAVNKTTDTTDKETSTPAESEKPAESATKTDEPKVSAVSTKFDFVPGDKVILYDDFSEDELGDFPAHWKLNSGTVETAEMDNERWLRLAGDYGRIRPKVDVKLPEFWTFEFDMHTAEPASGVVTVRGIVEGNVSAWSAELLQYGCTTVMFQAGSVNATTQYEGAASMVGRHHVMLLGRGTGLKIYVDTQRVINVPDVTGAGVATEIQIELSSIGAQPMITNVRFAEGNKPVKDPFAEGKFVTYGIYFDSGADVVQPESAPVLRQMAAYLETNPTVNVEVTGHTDNQGSAAGNLDLSKRRAASVAKVLTEQFKIAAERFKTDGMGDTKPVASNDNAEGRAMNRRVEFTKLLEKI